MPNPAMSQAHWRLVFRQSHGILQSRHQSQSMKTRTISRILATAAIALPSALFAIDTDSDGLDDSVETNTGTYVSPTNTGTNPNNPDSDADGAGDWYEVATIDANPVAPSRTLRTARPSSRTFPIRCPLRMRHTARHQQAGQSLYPLRPVEHGRARETSARTARRAPWRRSRATENKFPNLLNGANWSVRNDVMYRGVIAAIGNAALTPGQGNNGTTTIGPELGFGHVMGYYHDEPVLVLKSSEGGRALGGDFLPPGSVQYTSGSNTYAGYRRFPRLLDHRHHPGANPRFTAAYQFDQCFLRKADWAPAGAANPAVTNVTDVLDNFATEYPQWAAQGFEIAGFALVPRLERRPQLHRRIMPTATSRTWPSSSARSATTTRAATRARSNQGPVRHRHRRLRGIGTTPTTTNYPTRRAVFNAQLAVGDPVKYPEFAGNVKTMDARPYWRDVISESPANQQYHYNRNAETYMLVGDALGRGMIDLLGTAGPDTTPPALFKTQPADNATNVASRHQPRRHLQRSHRHRHRQHHPPESNRLVRPAHSRHRLRAGLRFRFHPHDQSRRRSHSGQILRPAHRRHRHHRSNWQRLPRHRR